jgi:heterotetrameric sarcosine oxidase gamma subunit
MVELFRRGVREQLAAVTPAASATGVTVQVTDIAAQFYVPVAQPANTRLGDDPYTLWLAPDRALQVGGSAPDGFVSDITDGLAVFDIVGPRASDVVAMGCTLTPALLAPGRCAQTVFGGVKILIYAFGDGFRLHVERPFAAFILEWLQQATTALQ